MLSKYLSQGQEHFVSWGRWKQHHVYVTAIMVFVATWLGHDSKMSVSLPIFLIAKFTSEPYSQCVGIWQWR